MGVYTGRMAAQMMKRKADETTDSHTDGSRNLSPAMGELRPPLPQANRIELPLTSPHPLPIN